MYTFILIVVIVAIISLCFFKTNFWENRYLVLLFIAGTALLTTVVMNYTARRYLKTKSEIVTKLPLRTMYVQDTLIKKKGVLKLVVPKYNFYENHKAVEYLKSNTDSLHHQVPMTIMFYSVEYDKINLSNIRIGYLLNVDKQGYDELKDIYVAPTDDTIGYYCKKKLVYDTKNSKWLTSFSMPRISTINIIYVPRKEFNTFPDSLIRKIPY